MGDVIVVGGLGGSPGENTGRRDGNQGHIRGYYDGLKETYVSEEDFEKGLRRLKRKVKRVALR